MREYDIFSGKRESRPNRVDSQSKKAQVSDHYKRNSREGYRRSQRSGQGEGDTSQGSSKPRRDNLGFRTSPRSEGRPYKRPFDSRSGAGGEAGRKPYGKLGGRPKRSNNKQGPGRRKES